MNLFSKMPLVLFGLFILTPIRADSRPNILYIFTDDQSHRTVSCYPEAYPWVKTPNIDRLANEGIRFSHVYMAPFCVASRITALTGNLPHAARGTFGGEALQGDVLAREIKRHPFWPQRLRESGYYTGQIGKWHIYSRMPAVGIDWDFSVYWHKKIVNQYYNDQKVVWQSGEPRDLGGYSTDRYTDIAIAFIKSRAEQLRKRHQPQASSEVKKPWYLWLCYAGVHMPQTAAKRHTDKLNDLPDEAIPVPADIVPPYPNKPRYVQEIDYYSKDKGFKKFRAHVKRYHRSVMSIDESVGRLYQALETTGQLDNTVIVFASDQGLAMGQHGLHRRKNMPYDATLRSPLLFRYPSMIKPGSVCKEPVNGPDVIQTFHELAKLKALASMDGMSLVPLLKKPEAQLPRKAMLMSNVRTYFGESIPRGVRHYQKIFKTGSETGDKAQPPYMMIHTRRYKYVRYALEGGVEELYDMQLDPGEGKNLAANPEFKQLLKDMRDLTIREFGQTQSGFNGAFVDLFPAIKN